MNKTLTLLALSLTCAIANVDASSVTLSSTHMDKATPSEIITREVRTFRDVRESREIRQNRNIKIKEVPTFRLARITRETRQNRFLVQVIREARKVQYVNVQDTLHLASIK